MLQTIGRTLAHVLALCVAGTASAAFAGSSELGYAPQPAWVEPIAIPLQTKSSGAAADLLLLNVQDRLGPEGTQAFIERAIRINAPAGLQSAGSLAEVWNPLTDTLTVHRARILRGGQTIDLLANGRRFTVLRRETNLEAAMIDGALTATLQPEGLQVGDVLDFAYTLVRKEPALAGHTEGGASIGHTGVIGRLAVRASWPAGKAFHIWKTDDVGPLAPSTRDGWTGVALDQTDAVSPEPPKGAPVYDRLLGLVEVDDFSGWKDVSATSWPLYDKASTLAAASPLKAEIARIAAKSADPKVRALEALKLVESQTRYLLVSLDAGGLTPAPADLTWTRRFGDCKGKTALLLALLKGLGIEAEPALVNTKAGEALDRTLPSMGGFDHVMVRAEIGGRVYWLDGTRLDDENLDVMPVPVDHWALPIRREGAELEPIGPKPPLLPYAETLLKADFSAGVDHPAAAHVEVIMRGDLALVFHIGMSRASPEDRDRALRQMFITGHDWLKPDKVAFTYNAQTMEARATADGTGAPTFVPTNDGDGARDWTVDGASIGYSPDFVRTSPYHEGAPYAVDYPTYTRAIIEVKLPDRGRDFEVLSGDAVNKSAAGMTYTRSAAISGGTLSVVTTERADADRFPASEAASAATTLRSLADYPTTLRYTPPKPAATNAAAAPASGDPAADAAAAFDRGDYPAADKAFTLALAKTPTAKLYYDRGAVRARMGQLDLAKGDMQAALRQDPQHAFAAVALGRMALKAGDEAEAQTWFARASAPGADQRLALIQIAWAYDGAKAYARAEPYWAKLMAIPPGAEENRSAILNGACWRRAVANADIPQALTLCDAAIAARKTADALDSRGLVDLRLQRWDKAAADYSSAVDAAKAAGRTSASSLFGRGLAEQRLGQVKAASADFEQARATAPKIDSIYSGYGLKP